MNNAKLNVYQKVLQEVCEKFDGAKEFIRAQSQEITQSGNIGRKTPISFNLRKYIEKHCNGLQ